MTDDQYPRTQFNPRGSGIKIGRNNAGLSEREGMMLQGIYDMSGEIARQISSFNEMQRRLIQQQQDKMRVRAYEHLNVQIATGGTQYTLNRRQSTNTIEVNTILVLVPSTAGTVTLQIGADVLPAIPNPPNGIIQIPLLRLPLSHTDTFGVTIQNTASFFLAIFGEQQGDAYGIG